MLEQNNEIKSGFALTRRIADNFLGILSKFLVYFVQLINDDNMMLLCGLDCLRAIAIYIFVSDTVMNRV